MVWVSTPDAFAGVWTGEPPPLAPDDETNTRSLKNKTKHLYAYVKLKLRYEWMKVYIFFF